MSSNTPVIVSNNSKSGFPYGKMFVGLIVIALLVFGGFLVYKKWWIPRQCNNQDADTTLNIASWLWVTDPDSSMGLSGNCTANTCATNFGTNAKGAPANATDGGDSETCPAYTPPATPKFTATTKSGKCTVTAPVTMTTGTGTYKSQMDCENACTGGCAGYDWDGKSTCDLSSGAVTDGDGTTDFTCYQKPAAQSK